jgi:hypothetical protein
MEQEEKFIGYLIHRCQTDAVVRAAQRSKISKVLTIPKNLRFSLYER